MNRTMDQTRRQYYAVRVGYAIANTATTTATAQQQQPPIKIRIKSAIFLNWNDAKQFVNNAEPPPSSICNVEYSTFDSIVDAEKYLLEGEKQQQQRERRDGSGFESASMNANEDAASLLDGASLNNDNCALIDSGVGETSAARISAAAAASAAAACSSPDDEFGSNSFASSGGHKSATKKRRRKQQAPEKSCENEARSMKSKGGDSRSGKENHWDKMYNKLVGYNYEVYGSIGTQPLLLGEAGTSSLNPNSLFHWCNSQCSSYKNSDSLSADQIGRLQRIGFELPSSWDEMYAKLETHKSQTGALDVAKEHDEDLFEWIKVQKTMLAQHFQDRPIPLSNENVNKLKSLGYDQVRPGILRANGIIDSSLVEAKWTQMYEQLKQYKARNNGSMSFYVPGQSNNELPPNEKALKYWVTEQRREYKKLQRNEQSKLSAQHLQRLTEIGLDLQPVSGKVSWEHRINQLKEFMNENGHCKVPIKMEGLGPFVSSIRQRYKARMEGKTNTLTDERVDELKELGFIFQAGKSPKFASAVKKSWEERLRELLEFKEEHGHTVVPQNSGPLGGWVRMQRIEAKKYKAGKKSQMTAERALKLTEIGFCFDASSRWKTKALSATETSCQKSEMM